MISSEALEYDPDKDKVITKNEYELNRLLDEHCKAKVDRDNKNCLMKNGVLEKVRIIERRRMGMSPSKSQIRCRSDDSDSEMMLVPKNLSYFLSLPSQPHNDQKIRFYQ